MNKFLHPDGGVTNMNLDDLLRDSDALYEFIKTYLFKGMPECIISGAACTAPGAGNDLVVTTDGFIFLDGELLKVDSGTYVNSSGSDTEWKYTKVTTYDSDGDKTFRDGTPQQTWQMNRGIPVNAASIGAGELDAVNGPRMNNDANIVHKKVVNIGAWDMDTDLSKTVSHGISDHTKILNVDMCIYPDSGSSVYSGKVIVTATGESLAGIYYWDATVVSLQRMTGGLFDAAGFSSTGINRGKLIIEYID